MIYAKAYLGAGDAQEAHTHEHSADSNLSIAEFYTIQIEHTQTVSADQAVQGQNLVHLNRGHKSATTLANDVRDGDNVCKLAGERRGDRGVTELDGWWLIVFERVLQHRHGELLSHGTSGVLSLLLLLLLGSSFGFSRCGVSGDSTVGLVLILGCLQCSHLSLGLGFTFHGSLVVRVRWSSRVQVGDLVGNRRGRLVETLHHALLLLVHVLHPGLAEVLANLLHVLFSAVEKSHTDVGLLQSANIVGAVTSHESSVTSFLEAKQNFFLLLGRDTSVDPGVSKQLSESLLALELGQTESSNTQILLLDNRRVQVFGGVDGNVDFVVDASPDKVLAAVVVLGSVQDQTFTVNNLDLASDVDSGKRVVASDHHNTVAALVQHADGLDSIILQRTLQNEETSKVKITLNLLTLEVVDAVLANFVLSGDVLVSESENTSTVPAEELEGLFVLGRHIDKHLADRFGCTLGTDKGSLVLLSG
jgi:hypothetical protein